LGVACHQRHVRGLVIHFTHPAWYPLDSTAFGGKLTMVTGNDLKILAQWPDQQRVRRVKAAAA